LALVCGGGTRIILAPQLESGRTVSREQLDQSVAIIRQRVDATGVSEAEISTSGQNVVVSLPGVPDDATMARLEASAKLASRPVPPWSVLGPTPSAAPSVSPGEEPAGDEATDGEQDEPDESPAPADAPEPSSSPEPSATPTPSNPSDLAWITDELSEEFLAFTCDSVDEATMAVAPSDEPL